MNDTVDNLILTHLREMRSETGQMRGELAEMRSDLARVEDKVDVTQQTVSGVATILAMIAGRVQDVEERPEAVETNVGIVE